MKIDSTNQMQPNFEALIKTPDVKYYFKKLPRQKQAAIDTLGILFKDVPIDVYVSTRKIRGKERLVAEVGPKTFKENIFSSPLKTVYKALKYAAKLHKEQQEINRLSKGMAIPRLN